MLALDLAPALDFIVVAGLPLAPSAGGQEHADQQPEQEHEHADYPQVRVRSDGVHFAPLTAIIRVDYAWRAAAFHRALAAPDQWPWRKPSLIEQAAGPRMTTKRVGRMNMISGTVMIAGRRAAFSSARIIRWWRNSADSTRSALASGVPYFSVWIMVVTTPRTASRSTRSARLPNAWRRSFRKPSSIAVSPNSSPSSG